MPEFYSLNAFRIKSHWGYAMRTISPNIDLKKYPEEIPEEIREDSHTQFVIGDLHGNALKLIHLMLLEGVFTFEPKNEREKKYQELRRIYEKPVEKLNSDDIANLKKLISDFKVDAKKSVTLLGDDLADRGNNDYFTLLVLKKLVESKVDVEILLSNHGCMFIKDYERAFFTGFHSFSFQEIGQSLTHMKKLITGELIKEEEVRDLVKDFYLPCVKGISYSLSAEGELTLFSHAPIGLETVEGLANKFKIPYNASSTQMLVKTIDQINAAIKEKLNTKQLTGCIEEGFNERSAPVPHNKAPLYRLIWNRIVGEELITTMNNGNQVSFVHGHTGPGYSFGDNHTNLDSNSGKSAEDTLGQCPIGYSSDLTPKQIALLTQEDWDSIEAKQKLLQQKKNNERNEEYKNKIIRNLEPYLEKLKEKQLEFEQKKLNEWTLFKTDYQKATATTKKLVESLDTAFEHFKQAPLTRDSLVSFIDQCNVAIEEAREVINTHRGFHKYVPYWGSVVLGILALATVLPYMLINYVSKDGCEEIFFDSPSTDSAQKVTRLVNEYVIIKRKYLHLLPEKTKFDDGDNPPHQNQSLDSQ